MSTVEITCWSTDRTTAAAFLETCGIARLNEDGDFTPIADVLIHPFRKTEEISVVDMQGNPIPGFHFNLRYYGSSADTLLKSAPKEGWPPEADVFDRTYILDLVDARTGLVPMWEQTQAPVPPGYETGGVRAFDPALIANRRNVWA